MEPRNMWQQIQGTYSFAAVWMRYDDYLAYGKESEEAKARFLHPLVKPNREANTWELHCTGNVWDLEKTLDEHMYYVLYAATILMSRKWIGADAVWVRSGE